MGYDRAENETEDMAQQDPNMAQQSDQSDQSDQPHPPPRAHATCELPKYGWSASGMATVPSSLW